MSTLLRFYVEAYDEETDDWNLVGSVLLPDCAPDREVEHALAAVGLYVPRGADELDWGSSSVPSAMIVDNRGAPLARLTASNPHGG